MKKKLVGRFLVVALLLWMPMTVRAEHGTPIAGCPDQFHLHPVHGSGHEEEHGEHHHIGADKDLNQDGWLCVKHVGKADKNHIHIDNRVPSSA